MGCLKLPLLIYENQIQIYDFRFLYFQVNKKFRATKFPHPILLEILAIISILKRIWEIIFDSILRRLIPFSIMEIPALKFYIPKNVPQRLHNRSLLTFALIFWIGAKIETKHSFLTCIAVLKKPKILNAQYVLHQHFNSYTQFEATHFMRM